MNWSVPEGAWFPSRIVKLDKEAGGALLVVLEDKRILRFESWDAMAEFRTAFQAEALAQDKKYLAGVAADRLAAASRKYTRKTRKSKSLKAKAS